jgi:MYXO-CTERM domain-containing protein
VASASAAVDGSLLTASATSGVNIPNINANAATDPNSNAQLSGTFEIVDTTNAGANPVSVLFSASLATSQSLVTTMYGMSSSSDVTFQFSLPDIGAVPFLSYDNPLDFGSNQSVSTTSSPTLTQSTTLMTNTPISFFLETDSESDGGSMTPEPASMFLAAAGLAALAVRRSRRG